MTQENNNKINPAELDNLISGIELDNQVEEPTKEEVKTTETKVEFDWESEKNPYKKRYSDSTRGAQELLNKIKSLEANGKENMSDKDNEDVSELKEELNSLKEFKTSIELEKAYKSKLNEIKKQNSDIDLDAFEAYISEKDPDNLITDINILVDGFKFNQKNLKPALESASSGPNKSPEYKLDAEQISKLRINSPKKYRELVLSGKINTNDFI